MLSKSICAYLFLYTSTLSIMKRESLGNETESHHTGCSILLESTCIKYILTEFHSKSSLLTVSHWIVVFLLINIALIIDMNTLNVKSRDSKYYIIVNSLF